MIQVRLLDTLLQVIFIEQLKPKSVADVAFICFTLAQDLSDVKDQLHSWKLN